MAKQAKSQATTGPVGATVAPPVHKVPVNRTKQTTGIARGAATALVWATANNYAVANGITTGPVPVAPIYSQLQGIPAATLQAMGIGTGGTGNVAYNTVQTQVGHYNTWAQGGTPLQGPPKRFTAHPKFVRGKGK